MPNQVDADIKKQQRYDEIYELSRKISEDSVKSRLGTEIYMLLLIPLQMTVYFISAEAMVNRLRWILRSM